MRRVRLQRDEGRDAKPGLDPSAGHEMEAKLDQNNGDVEAKPDPYGHCSASTLWPS